MWMRSATRQTMSCCSATSTATYESGVKNPINIAILKHDPLDISAYRKVDEIPFDFERRRLSIVTEAQGESC